MQDHTDKVHRPTVADAIADARRQARAEFQLLLAVTLTEEAREREAKLREFEEQAETISAKAKGDDAKLAAWQLMQRRLRCAEVDRERAEAQENECRLQVAAVSA